MKTSHRTDLTFAALAWALLLSVRVGAAEIAPPASEAPLAEGPVLTAEARADWNPLLQALAAKGSVLASFTEHRWFPFRKEPVVLEGEMRLSPERGLSLRYVRPEERIMIVDTEGLLLRDARGRSRTIKPDPNAPDPSLALLPVLRFDLAALEENFELHAARRGTAWRFDFLPRDAKLRRALGTISVWGEHEAVQRLEFRRSATQRVEIYIRDARTGVTFSADEQQRFFR